MFLHTTVLDEGKTILEFDREHVCCEFLQNQTSDIPLVLTALTERGVVKCLMTPVPNGFTIFDWIQNSRVLS